MRIGVILEIDGEREVIIKEVPRPVLEFSSMATRELAEHVAAAFTREVTVRLAERIEGVIEQVRWKGTVNREKCVADTARRVVGSSEQSKE